MDSLKFTRRIHVKIGTNFNLIIGNILQNIWETMWTILQSKSIDPDKNAVNGNYYFRFSFLYIVFSFYLPVLCYCPNIVASIWRQGGYFLFLVVLCVHQQRTGPGEWTEGVTAKLHNKAENCQARVLVHLQSQSKNSKKDPSWRYNLRYPNHR